MAVFADLPLGQARFIDFDIDERMMSTLTHREQQDQMLDWLLYTVVSAAGLSNAEMNQSLFDVPPVRYGYMRPVANFEYGPTRSACISKGRVVAILPKCAPAQRIDYLGHIADEQRKNLGEFPTDIVVFEYELDTNGQSAVLTRRESVKGREFFTERYGYHESKIKTLKDLQLFMEKVDDITSGQIEGNNLILGGRKIKSYKYRGIRVEDVATIWQSEKEIHTKLSEFKSKWDARGKEFNAKWSGRTYRGPLEKLQLEHERDLELNSLRLQIERERIGLRLVQGSGFSLDPEYDYAGLLADLKESTGELLSGDLISVQEIQGVQSALQAHDEIPLLKWVNKLKTSKDLQTKRVGYRYDRMIKEDFQFQAARYDGNLAGTEVGMVLFYTDLLAKLWAFNYGDRVPTKPVEDFKPLTEVSISPVFRQEIIELPGTRLWFGPQNKGFQLAGNGSKLLLARNATRVYAASSNPLQPGKETPPNAQSEAFLGWWNDHYEEVARYEPEYERLNEIMKWSLLIGWLNNTAKGDLMGFLGTVRVEHNDWFPQWVAQRTDLRFRDWEKVGFHSSGYKGVKTESMPILFSESYFMVGKTWTLSGGVSLAPKHLFEKRPVLSTSIDKSNRRSNLDYGSKGTSRNSLRTLEGVEYNLKAITPNRVSVSSTAKEGTKLRSRTGELSNLKFEREMIREPRNLVIEARAADIKIGDLSIDKEENGFKVGWRGRDVDVGYALARRASTSANPQKVIMNDPTVRAILELPGDGGFFVKLERSVRWLKMTPEREPSAKMAKGYQSRVADPDGKNIWQLAWIDKADLPNALGSIESITLDTVPGINQTRMKIDPIRGPPMGRRSLEMTSANVTIRGQIDPKDGRIFVPWKTLPESIRKDPGVLQNLVRPSDLEMIRQASLGEGQTVHYKIPETRLTGDERFIRRPVDKIARARVEQDLVERLRQSDIYYDREYFGEAIQCLQEAIDVHGPLPELTLRKGLAELSRGKLDHAVTAAEEARQRPLGEGEKAKFFDEVNKRLKVSKISSAERNNLETFAECYSWKEEIHANKVKSEADVKLFVEGDRLHMSYTFKENVKGKSLIAGEVKEIIQKNPSVYVQDKPGLNNLDWNVSIEPSCAKVISSGMGDVMMLSDVGLAHYKPAKIYLPNRKIPLRLATDAGIKTKNQIDEVRFHPPSQAASPQMTSGPAGSNDDDDKREWILLVIDKSEE